MTIIDLTITGGLSVSGWYAHKPYCSPLIIIYMKKYKTFKAQNVKTLLSIYGVCCRTLKFQLV
jgi:hypothetical protein